MAIARSLKQNGDGLTIWRDLKVYWRQASGIQERGRLPNLSSLMLTQVIRPQFIRGWLQFRIVQPPEALPLVQNTASDSCREVALSSDGVIYRVEKSLPVQRNAVWVRTAH